MDWTELCVTVAAADTDRAAAIAAMAAPHGCISRITVIWRRARARSRTAT